LLVLSRTHHGHGRRQVIRNSSTPSGTLIAYYYFGLLGSFEHDVRGLLTSLLFALSLPEENYTFYIFHPKKQTCKNRWVLLLLIISVHPPIRHYYIPLDITHTILPRSRLTELLQFDEIVDNERLVTPPGQLCCLALVRGCGIASSRYHGTSD
jgi:hypothetical protein